VACSCLSILAVRYLFSGRPGRRLKVMVAGVVSDTELTSEEALHSHTIMNTACGVSVPFPEKQTERRPCLRVTLYLMIHLIHVAMLSNECHVSEAAIGHR
jgi:hypothetical protein